MPFPASRRIFFSVNPLEGVVCQLRFPPILRIDAEAPAQFQERIRQIYPFYEQPAVAVAQNLPLPAEVLQGLPAEFLQMLSAGGGPTKHEFSSADRTWKFSLTREYVALTATKYADWKDFKAKLSEPLAALHDIYLPPFFVRIGLRYTNQIDRDRIGKSGVEWKELIRAEALGELAVESVGRNVERARRELIVDLEDQSGKVRILHGLRRVGDKVTYTIDSDFFRQQQTDSKEVMDVLDSFNRRAGHLFRWYITPALHAAMGPTEISPA